MFSNASRLEVLLEAVRDALVGMDQKGVIRFVNRQTELLFGYDRDDLIGEHIEKLVPEALWQIYASHRENYFADPRTRSSGLDLELSGRHQNGVEFPVIVSMSHIDTGDVLLVITGADEVAKQKRAVKDAELVTAIVENSIDAIIGTTREGVITSWNPAAERMYGYTSREIIGQSIDRLVPEHGLAEAGTILSKIKQGQPVERLETMRVRKYGTPIPVALTVSPIRGEDGAIVGVSAIHRDMTEQVAAAKELATTSWRYRLLAENASDVVVLTNPDREVTWMSSSMTGELGWAPEDLLGTRLADLLHPDDLAATAARRDELYSGREISAPVGGFVVRLRTKSGDYRWMSTMGTPVADESGEFVGLVSGWRDVDDLVRTREAAKAAEAALRATMDSLMDPLVLLEAVRDQTGQIVDFVYVDANPAARADNRSDHQDLIGARLLDRHPGIAGTGLDRCRLVVETGEPLALDDRVYAHEVLGGHERRYDIRAARVGDGLSLTWRDVTQQREAF